MTLRNLFLVMFAAVAIAMSIAFGLAPRFEEHADEPQPPTMAVATQEPIQAPGSRSAFIDQEADGHFWTRADVSGTQIQFLVDTGASIVALTYRDAQRLGLKPEELDFDAEIRTAGGVTYGAPVTIPSIRIGKVKIENVDAMILRTELDQSLLGMTFLGQLDSYEFRQGQLIIRQ